MNPFLFVINYYEKKAWNIQEWHNQGLISDIWALRNMQKLGLDAMSMMVNIMRTQLNEMGKFLPYGIDQAVNIQDTPGEILH